MVKLEFKNDIYDYKELWGLYSSRKKLFSSGDVIDLENGESFDISDFPKHKSRYIDIVLNQMKDIEDTPSSISKKRKLEKDKIRLTELELIYNNNTITTSELKELIKLKYSSQELKESYSFSSYSFMNTSIELPDLTYDELGKFYKLCHYHLTHRSNMLLTKKHDIRSNPAINKTLTDLFGIKERALLTFLAKLKKKGIIRYLTLDDKKYMIINPMYVLNGKLTAINYMMFKKDVDQHLPNIPKELRDLWWMEFAEIGLEM